MCGRFTLHEPTSDLVEQFAIDEVSVDEVLPRWNVAPTQLVLAVTTAQDGHTRMLGNLSWGLVPWWAKDARIGNRMINARAETLASSKAFRSAFDRRRCLIPASGFFEWKHTGEVFKKRPRRRPYYVRAIDGEPLALGGLWEAWRNSEGHWLRTCTIVTTTPNATISQLHDRMPVILAPRDWDRWLATSPLTTRERTSLLVPAPDDLLMISPVGDGVNNARNEGPDLIEPSQAGARSV
ncbi:MAG: SOS response-associated peptidase [Acidimicrobiales bacterium]